MSETEWWEIDDAAEPQAAAGGERELVPDGEHAFTIKHQEVNGDKFALRLADQGGRFGFVFVDLWATKKDGTPSKRTKILLRQLADALGLNQEQWKAAVRDGELVGREVRAETRQWQGDNGRTKVQVDRFAAATQPQPKATANPPRFERAVAPQASSARPRPADDDIPF